MRRPLPGRRIALLLEYDGSRYAGSQVQKQRPTIQLELETAIEKLTGARPRVALAGRTDAGVHAEGQVAAFNTSSALTARVLVRGLNALLPRDIAVIKAAAVEATFDPRRDACARTYRYTIYNAPVRSPLWRDRAWHVAEPLDIVMMQQAGASLVGRHDFASFSRQEPTSTVRCIRRCDVSRAGPTVRIEVEADAFLRQQMRRTAGALVQVGKGRLSVSEFRALIECPRPNTAGPVAPAHGLTLLRVEYPSLDFAAGGTLS